MIACISSGHVTTFSMLSSPRCNHINTVRSGLDKFFGLSMLMYTAINTTTYKFMFAS
jgi:hypothetical protein